MPRTVKTETTLYTFDELDESAKERAREWLRTANAGDSDMFDHVKEDAERCGKILGIAFDSYPVKLMGGGTRYDSKIWWTHSHSQGDGASFEGSYSYSKGAHKRIRQHAPEDKRLHAIADDLKRLQRASGFSLTADCTHRGSYYHSGSMEVSVSSLRHDGDVSETKERELTQALRDFADWIYSQIIAEDEYQNSNEQIDDSIRANEYEFTEEGYRA